MRPLQHEAGSETLPSCVIRKSPVSREINFWINILRSVEWSRSLLVIYTLDLGIRVLLCWFECKQYWTLDSSVKFAHRSMFVNLLCQLAKSARAVANVDLTENGHVNSARMARVVRTFNSNPSCLLKRDGLVITRSSKMHPGPGSLTCQDRQRAEV